LRATGAVTSAGTLSSQAIAVGNLAFVDKVKHELGIKAMYREVAQARGMYSPRERSEAYAGHFASENDALRLDNTIPWEENVERTET
jgi:hypothetical protein